MSGELAPARTARFVKRVEGARGDMRIYRLDPPYDCHDWKADDDELMQYEYVAVSAVNLDFGGFSMRNYRTGETMIFPANEEGPIDYGDLVMIEYKSHADALAQLGDGYLIEEAGDE